MKSTEKLAPWFVFLLTCFFLFVVLPARAKDGDALAREINTELREAQGLVFKGKAQEAQNLLAGTRSKIEQLKSSAPGHPSLRGLERKYDKLQKDISRRFPKADVPKAAKPVASKGGFDKLPGGASRCIREMDRAIKQAERALNRTGAGTPESKAKQARYEMTKAQMYWEDLQKKYPETVGHTGVVAAKGRMDTFNEKIASFEKGLAATREKDTQTEAAKEAGSATWFAKLLPYIASRNDEGYVPEKEFISGYTEDTEDMNHRMELFAEASNLFAEYQKAEFPHGKSDRLQEAGKKLSYKLESFKKELDGQAELYVRKATDELKRGVEFLAKNEERVKDGKTKPLLLHATAMNNLAKDIAWAENLVPGDSRLPDIKKRFEDLKKEQSKWRERMIESTVMLPDKFRGNEAGALKDKAEAVVKKDFSDASILRVNAISTDWNEERVLEFTDTTKSAVRYRVSRNVTVQVAAKRGADCYLYSVHVAKDRRSDGSWGQLYGHIMFTDRMLEKNVHK